VTHDLSIIAYGSGVLRSLIVSFSTLVIWCLVLTIPALTHAGDLHDAVKAKDVSAINDLLASGTDIDELDFVVGTALHIAVSQGDAEIAEILINHGADIEAESELQGARSLHLAAQSGAISIITLLLDKGADVESRDGNLLTPLVRAAAAGQLEAVELLIDHGAGVDVRVETDGTTPLLRATFNGRVEVVKLLLDRGADINAADRRGYTALHCAATSQSFKNVGGPSLIEYLAAHGADLNAKDGNGLTALKHAKLMGTESYKAIADVLRRLGASN
jgi:ankyrin repeat protein